MSFERRVAYIRIIWVTFIAIAAPIAVSVGYLEIVKYLLVILFLGGAACSVAGYLRYLPPGPKAPALLMLSIEKKGIDFFLALGFLLSVLFSNSNPNITWVVLAIYSAFGAAGAISSFLGMYLLIGAGRGWISRMVYKNPFYRDKEENSGGHRLDE